MEAHWSGDSRSWRTQWCSGVMHMERGRKALLVRGLHGGRTHRDLSSSSTPVEALGLVVPVLCVGDKSSHKGGH